MSMRRITPFLFLFLFCKSYGQDPQFTQPYGTMTYSNPAFAGTDTMGTIFLSHRNQWPKLSGTYQTTVLGWSQYIADFNAYSGIHYMYDNAGALKTSRISFNYAQNIRMNNLVIRPAMEFTYFQKTMDWSQLTFGDMIDPRRGFVYQTGDVPRGGSVSNVDFSTGIMAQFYNVTLGVSVHHFTEPNESLIMGNSSLPMKIGYQAAYHLEGGIGRWVLKIDPYLVYFSQALFQNFNFGLVTQIDPFIFGFNVRQKDSYALMGGFTKFKMRVTYCYEITTSSLGNQNTGGTHEFTFAYQFWKRKANKNFRQNKNVFEIN